MKSHVSLLPDSELVNVGTPTATGITGFIVGVIAKLMHSRRTANRRIKNIEATVGEIQADRELKYQEFNNHRTTMNDAIAGLRDSVDRVDAKVEGINAKLDTTAEGVAFIRGKMEGERDGRS